ncbi:nicotinate-nucleotide--dimethylbenzimidazole phosphoribosyltransferase [Streptomyces sp. NBC_01497]|uniref:nicotinate-nucleotide--dimethylbenzimidazole phosphoribosyltransferase n=1 Tax=Streptomyces sp. NBC_01497 TaxID=2903885 RepID=UPI002E34EAB0|nr:nicotinate-nucleotide--dimethylbenzimidazole phosphoribosyltransferase [Streptomyces sp. NBC_01497]
MTDTGRVPGEGQPENAGMAEQPGIPTAGEYAYLGPSETPQEDDDLLLMPSAQGAWSDPQPVPPQEPAHQAPPVEHGGYPVQEQHAVVGRDPEAPTTTAPPIDEPAPVTEPAAGTPAYAAPQEPYSPLQQHTPAHGTAYEVPGTPAHGTAHEVPQAPHPQEQTYSSDGRGFAYAQVPAQGHDPVEQAAHAPESFGGGQVPSPSAAPDASLGGPVPVAAGVAAATVRRPLHLGPPVSDPTSGVVRSLADRGPAARTAPAYPTRSGTSGPPTTGPEYLDIPPDGSAATQGGSVLAPDAAEAPQGGVPWVPEPQRPQQEEAAEQDTPVSAEAAPAASPVEIPADPEVIETQAAAVPQQAAEAPETPEVPDADAAVDPATPVQATAEQEPLPAQTPAHEAPAPLAMELRATAPEAAPHEAPAPEDPEPATADVAVPQDPAAEPGTADAAEAVAAEPAAPEPVAVEAPPAADPAQPDVHEPAPVPLAEAQAPAATPEQPAATPSVPDLEPAPEAGTAAPAAAGTPASPPAPSGYDEAERDTVLRVMRERRDIRNGFRSDPVPHDVLMRVLEAAHTAPSVGHSQPWDFVVIRSEETRRAMHELAERQRDAYAKSLPKGRAKQFKELKIEAILDTPVNIVVTADPTRGGRHTLGRHTQPQMAPYSSALAVENLWLAARAEGLGVGWVSFFDEREMVRALGLPDHLEVVAYLCVGYVDAFPQDPELMQAGWSKRRPLAWVVHEETYGRRVLPGAEPHDLLEETVANIRPLDAKALGEAWERQKRMTKPAGALGVLEIISAQLSGLSRMSPPPIPEPAAVAIFAGDHGVHAQGVTPWPQEVTGQMVANFLGGGAVCNAFATQVGAEVCIVDVGVASELPATSGLLPRKVRPGTADFTTGPAMTREEAVAAIEVGIETARDLVTAGNKALLTGEMGIANTTVSAALISVYTGMDPAEVTGRGTGINDETHARKVDVVRRALDLHRPDPADPIGVLTAVGGLEHAALVGFLLGGASMRTPVILDGVSAGAAALVARAIAPEALAACIAGHRSAEPGHQAALTKLGLRPLVDLDLRLGEGTGALLALPLVQSAARAMHEVATFDSAGVTEK